MPGRLNAPTIQPFSAEIAGMLSILLGVPVVQNNSSPQTICQSGSLHQYQAFAGQTSYHQFTGGPSSRKRTKDTSGTIGVSPHTQPARPPAKRIAPSSLFLQHDSKYTYSIN